MQPDPEFLRQHYASLCDEELLATDRADLVAIAQTIFDDEVSRRGLTRGPKLPRAARQPDPLAEIPDVDGDLRDETGKPAWLADAAEAYSVYAPDDRRDSGPAQTAAAARDALEAAGIPCYLDLYAEPPDETFARAGYRWRLLVPGNLNLRANSVVEQISNAEWEEVWKTHLELLSNADLRAMTPQFVFCALFDRVERANRVYEEEIERRGLK
jgi:hypothetical protein